MTTLFVQRPGVAVQLPADVPTGNVLLIGGNVQPLSNGFTTYSCIVTGITYETGSGYQLLHSLNDMIYAYTFGERIGNMVVAGIAVAGRCDDNSNAPQTGVDGIMRYYDENRMSRTGAAVQLVLGRTKAGRMRGFLTNMRLNMTNPESRISEFALQFRPFRESSGASL